MSVAAAVLIVAVVLAAAGAAPGLVLFALGSLFGGVAIGIICPHGPAKR